MEDTEDQKAGDGALDDAREREGRDSSTAASGVGTGGLSFSFQKTKVGSRVRRREGGAREDGDERDFILSVEGKEIQR